MKAEAWKEIKNKIKKVIISRSSKVTNNHSENIRKATDNSNQILNIKFVEIEKDPAELNIET